MNFFRVKFHSFTRVNIKWPWAVVAEVASVPKAYIFVPIVHSVALNYVTDFQFIPCSYLLDFLQHIPLFIGWFMCVFVFAMTSSSIVAAKEGSETTEDAWFWFSPPGLGEEGRTGWLKWERMEGWLKWERMEGCLKWDRMAGWLERERMAGWLIILEMWPSYPSWRLGSPDRWKWISRKSLHFS